MSSELQLDMRNLSLGRRHLVNAYEVEAGIGVIAGNTVWSMPERLECEVLQKARYINTLTFTFLPLNTTTSSLRLRLSCFFQSSPRKLLETAWVELELFNGRLSLLRPRTQPTVSTFNV